ncbi:MAG: type IV pilus secretin PilQ [Desulfobacterales bacterium]|nr:type IV pilus secretin PilQ [Desulfobacterales bacterium]
MYRHEAKARSIRLISLLIGFVLVVAGCSTLSPQEGAEKAAVNTINRVEAASTTESGRVEIQSSEELQYTAVKQLEPLGVIFYFPQARLGEIDTSYTPESGVIKSVDLSSATDQQNQNVRMEVELAENLAYEVDKNGPVFTVAFKGKPDAAASRAGSKSLAAGSKETVGSENATGQETSLNSPERDSRQSRQDDAQYRGLAIVEDIGFETTDSGKSVLSIGTSRQARYNIDKIADKQLKLTLSDAAIPEHIDRRPLITTRFDTAVDRVIPYEVRTRQDTVEVVVELRESVPYWVERSDGQIKLHFDASTVGPRPYSAAELPDWQRVLEDAASRPTAEEAAEAESTEGKSAREAAEAEEVDWLFEKEEYTGEKIALDFHETDIKNVFRILQQVSGKNYAIDSDVEGTVTISMDKPIPWDQVLDLILKQNRLGKVEDDDIIRIATQQTLREEEQARQERIEAYRARKEQEKSLEPLVTRYIPVNYANAQNEVLPHVKDSLSDRGKVSVDARNNQLIITDTRARIDKAREVVSEIDKVTPQVVIEARIVEINEDFAKDIGTEFSLDRSDIASSTMSGIYGHDVVMNYPASATSSIGFAFENLGTSLTLDAKLSALEEQNNVKIVSAPKIVTLDNKKASITQGFEYPYQTVEDDDVQIEFKEIDLTLEVTPHVTPDDRISLQIFVTKNDIAEQTAEAPALSTNEAETELLVDDGSTIAIGGIKKNTTSERVSGFPVLKDIPVLGWLFKRHLKEKEKSELLIFMTPRIVQLEQRKLTATSGDSTSQ